MSYSFNLHKTQSKNRKCGFNEGYVEHIAPRMTTSWWFHAFRGFVQHIGEVNLQGFLSEGLSNYLVNVYFNPNFTDLTWGKKRKTENFD